MLYCCREHQAAHRPYHAKQCWTIDVITHNLELEEAKIQSRRVDPFTERVGFFGGQTPETQDYVWGKFCLISTLRNINSRRAVSSALDHALELFWLCQRDTLDVVDFIPSLMLRLDRDQDCYDFVHWFHNFGKSFHWILDRMKLPSGSSARADVWEPVTDFCGRRRNFGHRVALVLLKIKMMLDLIALQNCAIISRKLPPEILALIRTHIPRSPVIANDRRLVVANHHSTDMRILKSQIGALYETIEQANERFWPALLEPGENLTVRVQHSRYGLGSSEEMQQVLQACYDSWADTPGAIEAIRTKIWLSNE